MRKEFTHLHSGIQPAREGCFGVRGRWREPLGRAPLKDVARLYRLAAEKTGAGVTTYHAVQEEGVSLRYIAETIGKG